MLSIKPTNNAFTHSPCTPLLLLLLHVPCRLAHAGKLDDIRSDWEDWQLDMMLSQVKARSQAAQQQQQLQPRPGTVTPSNGGSSRRRGRCDVEEVPEPQADEPRRVSQQQGGEAGRHTDGYPKHPKVRSFICGKCRK